MEKKYSKALSKANVLFGVHCLLKGASILLLFIILYSVIWIKEKYLNYIKANIYIQLLIFLFLIAVILSLNNPNFFDICLKCTIYMFLFLSIFQISIIILEFYGVLKNFKSFTKFFHECSYFRSYNDIIESKYQRTCLFYNEDPYSIDKYKYICFYNSEEEYYNKFCDGIICRQNNKFYNNINDYTKCVGVNINYINFIENSIYYKKEKELFGKKKNKKIYLCSRKTRLDDGFINNNDKDKNNESKYDVKNIECPDNNPSKKYIIFIYIEVITHILADFLFIYEFFVVKNLNKIFFEMKENSRQQFNINTINSQTSSSNNRINTPSAEEIVVNVDKKKLNFQNENEEDIKIEEVSEDKNYVINNNRNKRKLKIDINDNRRINIISINQNIQINPNSNGGTILLNALKSPKIKGRFKNKRLKEKERREKKGKKLENEDIMNKKHQNLKSSQLQNLINISISDDESNSSKEVKDIDIIIKKNRKKANKNNNNKEEEKIVQKINIQPYINKNEKKADSKSNQSDKNEIYFNKKEINMDIPVYKSANIEKNPNIIDLNKKLIFDKNKYNNKNNLSFEIKKDRYEDNKEENYNEKNDIQRKFNGNF